MSAEVIEQFEATIQAGGVDVLVEIVKQGDLSPVAQVAITQEDGEELDLTAKDVAAIHDLTGRVLAALSEKETDQPGEESSRA